MQSFINLIMPEKKFTITAALPYANGPVHIGHLRMALELSELFQSDVHLLPCFKPVHRGEPGATSAQRLEMLNLATENEPTLIVDP